MWETWLVWRHWIVSNGLRPLYDKPETRALLKQQAIWEIEGGLELTARDVYLASTQRSTIYQAFNKLFTEYDIVVLPTAQIFPFDPSQHSPLEVAGMPMDTYHRYMEVVVPATLIGSPSLSVPVGFNAQGLPMGMQLIGPHAHDMEVLSIGQIYEQETRWNLDYRPKLLQP